MFELILLTGLLAAALSQLLPENPGGPAPKRNLKQRQPGHRGSSRKTKRRRAHAPGGVLKQETDRDRIRSYPRQLVA